MVKRFPTTLTLAVPLVFLFLGAASALPMPDAGSSVKVVGRAVAGEQLTCVSPAWSSATSIRYAWFRDGQVVADEIKPSFRPTFSDVLTRLTCSVTAEDSEGSTTAFQPEARLITADTVGRLYLFQRGQRAQRCGATARDACSVEEAFEARLKTAPSRPHWTRVGFFNVTRRACHDRPCESDKTYQYSGTVTAKGVATVRIRPANGPCEAGLYEIRTFVQWPNLLVDDVQGSLFFDVPLPGATGCNP